MGLPQQVRQGWAAQFWSPIIGAEHRAVRDRVGLFDLTNFFKIEVSGPGALAFLIVFLALYAGVGYGLLKMMKWARIAAIVLGVLALCSFPIGTAMGGYVLYLMFQEENKQAFA